MTLCFADSNVTIQAIAARLSSYLTTTATMGNNLSCVPCKKGGRKWRRRNKIFPQTTLNSNRQESRTSSVILKELQELGVVQEAAKEGGLTFVVDVETESFDERRRVPRRLPTLISKINREHVNVMPEDAFYTKDEKSLIAEIMANEEKEKSANTIDDKNKRAEDRRKSVLDDRGKMARKSEERRKEVLERREAKRKERIVKTKERLEKERLDIQTVASKPKRPSYEERRSKLLEKRKQLLLEKKAKAEEKVDDDDMETTQNTITEPAQNGLPDVST